ncbi:MAG: tal-B [Chlamydiales bacterium]|jgi:transaldolase|nr:tal-B [Chlamydiales bacterium]
MNQLSQLRQMTTIVADTGDIDAIRKFVPTDATTNPSLIYQAAQLPQYRYLIEEAVREVKALHVTDKKAEMEHILDHLMIRFGLEILKIVPGRVSIEVDARHSFNTAKNIEKAHVLIKAFEKNGIDRKRVLIKLASTWEGIQAAQELEKEGIHCNMTLIFSLAQAMAAGEAKATLISPFVGRILDWYAKQAGAPQYLPEEDPGVLSVKEIFTYYKKFGYKTQVMGASFRNKDEILQLAGCDLLTIAPKFLSELEATAGSVEKKLDEAAAKRAEVEKKILDEKAFRWMFNENAMAVEKLSEGIRNFGKDTLKLEALIAAEFLK